MKVPLSVTVDKSIYDELKARKGAVPMSRYVEIQLRRAWALDSDKVDELIGAARTRDGEGGAAFRSNLMGWQRYLVLAKIKHVIGEAIDDEGEEIRVVRAHVVRAKTLDPFEVRQDPVVKVEEELKEAIHDFSRDSCLGCDLLFELASRKETPPTDPPGDSVSLNARIAQDAFERGDRFLVLVRSVAAQGGTISAHIWALAKSSVRRARNRRR